MTLTLRSMPTVRVFFCDDVPPEIRMGVETHVMANLDLLPAWCVYLVVDFARDEQFAAQMRPKTDYRRGYLTIGAGWLTCDEPYRERTIVHEFQHVHLAPLHLFAASLIEHASGGSALADTLLREQLRVALEQTTVDLEELVMRLLYPGATSSAPPMRSHDRGIGPTTSPRNEERSC